MFKFILLCLFVSIISAEYIPVQDWDLKYDSVCACNYCIPQNWELCYNICKNLPFGFENKSFGVSSIAYPFAPSKCGFTAELPNIINTLGYNNWFLRLSTYFSGTNKFPEPPKIQWVSTEGIKSWKIIPSNQTLDLSLTNYLGNLTIFLSVYGSGSMETDIYIYNTYIFNL